LLIADRNESNTIAVASNRQIAGGFWNVEFAHTSGDQTKAEGLRLRAFIRRYAGGGRPQGGGNVRNGYATKWERSPRVQAWIKYYREIGHLDEILQSQIHKRLQAAEQLN